MFENVGYYRYPCPGNGVLFFVCENDIWQVSIDGGIAQRFTNTPGIIKDVYLSPDSTHLAYSAGDYGSLDIYVISLAGGMRKRLTYYPANCNVVGWDNDSQNVLFCSNIEGNHDKDFAIYKISKDGGDWNKLNLGFANKLVYSETGDNLVIQRGYNDPAVWKSYFGGRAGKLWFGNEQNGFQRLSKDQDSHSCPMMYKDRIYFVADIEGSGNIYSFDFTGNDQQQHTFHADFYVRNPNIYKNKICYQQGGAMWMVNLETQENKKIEITIQSCGNTLQERFVSVDRNLTGCQLSPKGDEVIVTSRGQLFHMKNWGGGVRQFHKQSTVRHKYSKWLADGEHIVTVVDISGEDDVIIFTKDGKRVIHLGKSKYGHHIDKILPAPQNNSIAVGIDSKLFIWDWSLQSVELVDESKGRYIRDFSWSPDSKWLAYTKYDDDIYTSIFLYEITTKKIVRATTPEAYDYSPCFSNDGKYLFFLSKRVLNPHQDSLQSDYGFPVSAKPYLLVLAKDNYSPFSSMITKTPENTDKSEKKDVVVHVDCEKLVERIEEIPIHEGLYLSLSSFADKIFLLKKPLEGKLSAPSIWQQQDEPKQKLIAFDLKTKSEEVIVEKLTSYSHSYPYKEMVLKVGKAICVVKSGSSYKKIGEKPEEKTGWIDLKRIKICVKPQDEWHQMFLEAWRLQRDFFWDNSMSGLDWETTLQKYLPLIKNVRTRNELSDIISEMHGDLQTSHAYCAAEELPAIPFQRIGLLGAKIKYENEKYRIQKFYRGDLAHTDKKCPLLSPGLNLEEGDAVIAINGETLDKSLPPGKALINLAKEEVDVLIESQNSATKNIIVQTLSNDSSLRYIDWVNDNRAIVAEKTQNQIGYIHIPDMGTQGLISFHRDFLWQYTKKGLIVDIRFNGGGHISPIILAKLQKKAIGTVKPRRGKEDVYPRQTHSGPIVALCNEYTGSDGDMFCFSFKKLNIGTLIGTRTWGGIVGIIPDKKLIDGGIVTQPEYAICYNENIENRGVAPDIEVENTPESYMQNEDTQLDIAIKTILGLL